MDSNNTTFNFTKKVIIAVNNTIKNMRICTEKLSSIAEVMLLRGFSTLKDIESIWSVLLKLEKEVYLNISNYDDFEASFESNLEELSEEERKLLVIKANQISLKCIKQISNELSKILTALFGAPKLLNGKKHEWTNSENIKRKEKALEFLRFMLSKISSNVEDIISDINETCIKFSSKKFNRKNIREDANLYIEMMQLIEKNDFSIGLNLGIIRNSMFILDVIEKILDLNFETGIKKEIIEKYNKFTSLIRKYHLATEKVWDCKEKSLWIYSVFK